MHRTEQITISGVDYTVAVTFGANCPVTVFLNQIGNHTMGNYIYTIQGYSSNLYQSSLADLHQLSSLLNKKFGRPVYLNVNGHVPDTVAAFLEITGLVDV
jgi:hypothetical protein